MAVYSNKKRRNETTTLDPVPQADTSKLKEGLQSREDPTKLQSKANPSDLQSKANPPRQTGLAAAEALGKVEKAKSRLMEQQGISEQQAISQIALTGGTERFFPKQRTVAEVQQEEALQAQAAQIGGSQKINLGNPADIIDATTIGTNLPSIAAGIAGGATIGSAIPGVGTLIGGAVGGVTAYLGKLSVDRRQNAKNAKKLYTIATGERYNEILNAAEAGATPSDVMVAYDTNLENIRESHRALRELTKNKVGEDLSGAMDELIDVEMWLQHEPEYRQQVLASLANPTGKQRPITPTVNVE